MIKYINQNNQLIFSPMKKILTLIALATMIFTGCSKNDMQQDFSSENGETLQKVTFKVDIPNETQSTVSTKAVDDGDGDADYVNRCIMEIYYGDKLFARKYAKVSSLTATFNLQIPANRTYTVAFWADYVDAAGSEPTESELQVDKFYVTDSEYGLKAVSIKGTHVGNDDKRDAFFHCNSYTVAQGGSSFGDNTNPIVLKRPFSQINVITTDLQSFKQVPEALPSHVDVKLKNVYRAINLLSGELSDASDLSYVSTLYNVPDPIGDYTNATLSMDYIFAPTDKSAVDIDWKATKSGDSDIVYAFTNIPYQRNYRTNIKGNLLTSVGTWNVTIDPIWDGSEDVVIVSATVDDIDGMNSFVAANPQADQYDVTFSDVPNDAGVPGTGNAHAILTTPLAQNNVLNVAVQTNTNTLYVGDYESQSSTTVVTTGVNSAIVNINVPSNKKIETLIINAPSKSVYLNGVQVTSCGTLTNVESTTSANTLVVQAGQAINTLTVHQGGLEIHGSVQSLVIEEDNHDNNPVKVRTSENLSQTVFDIIMGDDPAVHDYIDRPYFCEKANGSKWDIVPSVCIIGTVASPVKGFATLNEAFTAAEDGNTITLLSNVELSAEITVNKSIVLDLNGHSINSNEVSAFQVNHGSLDVKGYGTISGTPANHKEIWLKGSTNAADVDYSVLKIGQDVKVACANGYGIMISANGTSAYGAKITVDGQVDGYYGALYVNGTISQTEGNVPEIVVNGTLITNEGSAALYAAGYAKYTINSTAALTGGDAMYLCAGIIVVNGGSFVGNAPKAQYNPSGSSGYDVTGDALVVDRRTGYSDMTVSVKGGSFKSINADAVGSYATNQGDELKNFLTGGVYSSKPAEACAQTLYYVIENQDSATKSEYPWTVSLVPLPGSGTEADPFRVSSPSDLKTLGLMMRNPSEEMRYFAMQNDITLTASDCTPETIALTSESINTVIPVFYNGEFDGNDYTLTMNNVTNSFVFGETSNQVIKNLKVNFISAEDASIVYYGNKNTSMVDVETLGDIKWSSGNQGAFYVYFRAPHAMTRCVNRAALQTKTADPTMYDAVFLGYGMSKGTVTLTDCLNEGSLNAGQAGLIVANCSYSAGLDFVLSSCKNNGTVRVFGNYSQWNDYNYLTALYQDKPDKFTFKIDGTIYTTSTDPKWYDLDAQGGVIGTGTFLKGPADETLALNLNADKTFTITPSTATAAYYTVSVGIYAGTTYGSTRVYATETVTSGTTTLKYLSFVDDVWVAANPSAVQGILAGTTIYTLGNVSYYYVGAGNSLGGQPCAPEMVSVTAYNANNVIVASASLTQN